MSTLNAHLFGQFHLQYNQQPVTGIDRPRLQSRLSYLVVQRRETWRARYLQALERLVQGCEERRDYGTVGARTLASCWRVSLTGSVRASTRPNLQAARALLPSWCIIDSASRSRGTLAERPVPYARYG